MTGFSKRFEKDCNQLVCIHICIFHTPHLMVGYDVPHRRFLLSEELSWMIHQKAHPHLGKWWANLFTGKSRWNTAWWKSWQLFLFDENWLDDCMVHVLPKPLLWALDISQRQWQRAHEVPQHRDLQVVMSWSTKGVLTQNACSIKTQSPPSIYISIYIYPYL